MQNRYVGDIGDFAKYSILRSLIGGRNATDHLSLGIVWFLTPNEGHNADGMHVSYLNKPEYRQCDASVYDILENIVSNSSRSVFAIQASGLFPEGTRYVDFLLDYKTLSSKQDKIKYRNACLEDALTQTADRDLVFLDPDNGFEVKSVPLHTLKGPKYVGWEEVGRFLERDQSLVVYHHLNRTATALVQISEKLAEIRERFGFRPSPIPVLFRRGSLRVFFVFPSPRHVRVLTARLNNMLSGSWAVHLEIVAS